MPDEKYIRAVRLEDSPREELLNHIELLAQESASAAKQRNRRRDERLTYRPAAIPLIVTHPGGGASRLLVCGRNISAGGLSFVHCGFLHRGSRCNVMLTRLDGQMQSLEAQVVNCRHVSGTYHEVGLKFDQRINLADFLHIESKPDADAKAEAKPAAARALYVDHVAADQQSMKAALESCGYDVTLCGEGVAATDLAKTGGFEVVLIDSELPGMSAPELVEVIRAQSQSQVIVLVMRKVDGVLKTEATRAGCAGFVRKPVEASVLAKTLGPLVKRDLKPDSSVSRAA